jgi:type IV pilus assembly protein PilZ
MATEEAGDKSGESRVHSRKPIELKVEYKRINAFFADYTRNISHGGTFIKTNKPLPIGTEFVFKLQIPNLEEPLSIQGQVRWIIQEGEETAEEEEAGMGIRFVYREGAERATIESLVEGLMVDSLGRLLTTKLMARNAPDPDSEENYDDGGKKK